MSSFMVSNDTLCMLATYLATTELPPYMEYAIYYERKKPVKIHEALRDMNHRALACRYGESANDMWDPAFYVYHPASCDTDKELITRITCYLYQCNEGMVDKEELYLALQRLCGDLAVGYVLDNLEPYESERWWR